VLGIRFVCTPRRPKSAPFQYGRSFDQAVYFPLACLFDSLVRVSRRVKAPHFQCQCKSWRVLVEATRSPRPGWDAAQRGFIHATVLPLGPLILLHLWFCPAEFLRPAGVVLRGWPWPMKWRYFQCRCRDFRSYVTLFPKYFSNFRSRYLSTIGLPTLYSTLADEYLPLYTAFPSSATLFYQPNVMPRIVA